MNYAELRAIAATVHRYDDGGAIHTSGDETCVDDCAACLYEGAAGRVLLGLLDRLERYKTALERIARIPSMSVRAPDPYQVAADALNPTEANND